MVTTRRHGRTKLGCLVGLALVATVAYFAWNIGQPYWRYYQYQDAMAQEARFAARNGNDVIVEHLRAKADSLGLPDAAKKIQIRRKQDQIWIWAEYFETVETPLVVRDIEFQPHAERVF